MNRKEKIDAIIWLFVVILLIVIPIAIAKTQENKAELKALQSQTEFMKVMSDGGIQHECYVCYKIK